MEVVCNPNRKTKSPKRYGSIVKENNIIDNFYDYIKDRGVTRDRPWGRVFYQNMPSTNIFFKDFFN